MRRYAWNRLAKANIGRHQRTRDILITNETNQLLKNVTSRFQGTRYHFNETFSSLATVCIDDGTVVIQKGPQRAPLGRTDKIPVIGPGNLQNALAAITCAVALGGTVDQIQEGLQGFKPLEHRLEFVATRHEISFYNDSLATIPEALAYA